MVEDIVGGLASLQEVFVISRNSTLKYRGRLADLSSIGDELGVRYILSGSIRRSDNQIRISAELADVETLGVLWTDRVSGDLANLFSVQDRLTERVIQTIAPNIYGAEIRRVARKRTENFDAYDYMLRGLDLLYRLTPQEFEQAREMFCKSIELDDSYAAPHALMALWHSIRVNQGWSPDPPNDVSCRPAVCRGRTGPRSAECLGAFAVRSPAFTVVSGFCDSTRSVRSRHSMQAPIPHSPGPAAAPHSATWATRPRAGAGQKRRCDFRPSTHTTSSPTPSWP